MRYSVFYRIQNRYKFFDRFCKRYIKIADASLYESMVDTNEELMELIVKMILDNDKENLICLLSKQNSKNARIFFDYFSSSKTKHMKKMDIIEAVDSYFRKENEMKKISEFMAEKVKPIKLTEFKYTPFKLNEADDDMDFGETADDAGGDDAGFDDAGFDDATDEGGGDDAGFGDDAGGDPFGDSGDEGGDDNGDTADTNDENQEDDDQYDMAGHDDDPDFASQTTDSDSDLGQPSPAGQCVLDVDGVFKSLNAVIESLPDVELAEIDAVKKAVTLIFNGKILKPEDVTFQNPKNAAYLLKKIGENLNEKTNRYMLLKIKQPLIKLRDSRKEELAKMKADTQNIRTTLSTIDK